MGALKSMREELLERARKVGIPLFRDEDIYEALLSFCVKEKDAGKLRELGKRLFVHLGGFERLTDVTLEELKSLKGMDEGSALFIYLMAQICKRGEEQRERARLLTGPRAAGRFFASKLSGLDHEVTMAACLTDELRCARCEVVAQGDAFSTEADPYDIVGQLYSAGTRTVILAHNHVTGDPQPSREDLMVTDTLLRSFKRAGLVLLDHIIVSGDRYVSLAANGHFLGEEEKIREIYRPRPAGDGDDEMPEEV